MIEGFFFKKEADVVGRFFEVIIKIVRPIFSIENCDFLWGDFEVTDKIINLLYRSLALLSWDKVGDDGISVLHVELNCFWDHDWYFEKEFYKLDLKIIFSSLHAKWLVQI